MTIPTYSFREGDTDPIVVTLYDGQDPANITGYGSVSVYLRSIDGAVQSEATTGSGVTVTGASTGEISIAPDGLTTPLAYSRESYYGYFVVVDGSGKRASFPSNGEFIISMLERFSGDG